MSWSVSARTNAPRRSDVGNADEDIEYSVMLVVRRSNRGRVDVYKGTIVFSAYYDGSKWVHIPMEAEYYTEDDYSECYGEVTEGNLDELPIYEHVRELERNRIAIKSSLRGTIASYDMIYDTLERLL